MEQGFRMVVIGSGLGFMSLGLGVVDSLAGLGGGGDFFSPLLFDVYWIPVEGQLGVGFRSIGIRGLCLGGEVYIMLSASGSDLVVWPQIILTFF